MALADTFKPLEVCGAFTSGNWRLALSRAVEMGLEDAFLGRAQKSGHELACILLTQPCRKGHQRYVRHAYMAGRFQVHTMGRD